MEKTTSAALETAQLNNKARIRRRIRRILLSALAVLVTMFMCFPIYWMIVSSLKTQSEVLAASPSLWPSSWQFVNYVHVLARAPFHKYFINTVIVTAIQMTVEIFTGILAAYGFSKGNFRFKQLLFVLVLGAMMVPIQVTFIPLYILTAKLGWIDTYAGLVFPNLVSAYTIFMLRQAFLGVDESYLDAAKVDGMNKLGVIFRVLVPMCKPTLITVGLISFIGGWNGYFWPKIVTSSDAHRVLTIGLTQLRQSFGGEVTSNYHEIMAGAVMSVLPVLAVFAIFQKHMLSGYTKAAMK